MEALLVKNDVWDGVNDSRVKLEIEDTELQEWQTKMLRLKLILFYL